MGVSEIDKAFLQHMFAAKSSTMNNGIKVYNDLLTRMNAKQSRKLKDVKDLDNVLTNINKHLETTDFQFKTIYSPWEKQIYCGLCNTIEDEAVKCAITLNKQDIPFFFAVVDELREFDGEIKLVDAQNVAVENQALSVAENGRSINRLNQMGWLKILRRQNDSASVILGPRALLELPGVRNWVREYTQEGGRNPRHNEREEKTEEEEEEEDEEQVHRPRRKRRSRQVQEEDDDDDVMEGEELQTSQSQKSRRKSRHQRL